MSENRIVSMHPRAFAARAVTPIPAPAVTPEEWLRALRLHMAYVGGGPMREDPTPPCLETDVNCNGTIVTVETCCQVGESPEACVARHARAVESACD